MERSDRQKEFDRRSESGIPGVVDMDLYREIYGPATQHTPAADGSGGARTPDPKPEVEPDVPDGYVREERLDEVRQQFRQRESPVGPTASVSSSGGSSFDRLIDRASSWLS